MDNQWQVSQQSSTDNGIAGSISGTERGNKNIGVEQVSHG
jgi:hypothetical protein